MMTKSKGVSRYTDIILDSIADGVFTVDKDFRIRSFNRAAERITGVAKEEAIGSPCKDVFHSSLCDGKCALEESIKESAPVLNKLIFIINTEGKKIPITISASPLRNEKGEVIGGVETFRDISEIAELRKELQKEYSFHDIISKNAEMQKIFAILPDIAVSDSNVLISGDSGTGKKLIARAIHNLSARKDRPFVIVNCGAIPDTLLESELFGYKPGAFTDARKEKPGKFLLAEGGTIFLDEIGDISPASQVKFLRVLEEKEFEPLGGTTSLKADVRIITATNKDLAKLVSEGLFREDLYYRLNVAKISLPPLRERKEDIPLLVDHLIRKFNALKGKSISSVSDNVLSLLMQYDFPGNIRELENIIEYAFILCHDDEIKIEHLPEEFWKKSKTLHPFGEKKMTLEEIEKMAIENALIMNNYKRMATCRQLGISKGTLRRKIESYGIKVPRR